MPPNWPAAATQALNHHYTMYAGLPWAGYKDMCKIYGPRLSLSSPWVTMPQASEVRYKLHEHMIPPWNA